MKTITIDGKEYDLHYGIDFIREMDKRYQIDANGFPFGIGIQSAVIYLTQGNPVVLEDIILSATHTLKSVPSKDGIEAWLEAQEDFEPIFADFLAALETAPMTKRQVKTILANMDAVD